MNITIKRYIGNIITLTEQIKHANSPNLCFQELKSMIDHIKDDEIVNSIISSSEIQNSISEIRNTIQEYESKHEKQYVLSILSAKNNEIYFHNNVVRAIRLEGKAMCLRKGVQLAFLGSGAYPITAITYTKFFNVNCTCIDSDFDAIKLSRQLCNKLQLGESIRMINCDALNCDLNKYDIIFIAAACTPKKEVLDYALRSKNAIIAYRRPVGLYKLWYDDLDPSVLKNTRIVATMNWNNSYPIKFVIIKGTEVYE